MSLYRSLDSEPCDIINVSGGLPHTSYPRMKATTALRGSLDDKTRKARSKSQGEQRDRRKVDFGVDVVAGAVGQRVRRGGYCETIEAWRRMCNH